MKIIHSTGFYCLLLTLFQTLACSGRSGQPLRLWYEKPATEWIQAAPIGNGRLGAMVYGGIETETVALNEISMWAGQYDEHQEIPCGKETLAYIRQFFFEGNLREGNDLATRLLAGRTHSFGTHLPVGDLKMKFHHSPDDVRNYLRETDIETAVTRVSYQAGKVRYTREYICSNPDDVLLIKLGSNAKNALTVDLSLNLLRKSDIQAKDGKMTFTGQALFRRQKGGVHYIGEISVSAKNGTVSSENGGLHIAGSDEIVIAVDIRTDYKDPEYRQRCAKAIENAVSQPYDRLKKKHIADYSRLFKRVTIDLGSSETDKLPTDVRWKQLKDTGKDDPGLFALFFQYGRYLLLSSSRENSPLPANLQGVWNDNLACNMGWTCDYHLDINTQQNYWLANIGNLPECNAPLFSYVEDLSVHGAKTAAKVYGARGWVAHTVANIWGYTAPGGSINWGLFPTAGAWMASHLWEHYRFTQDKGFLRERAYPILKKSAEFFLDYMVEDPQTGYLMTGPSTSPENSFLYQGGEWSVSMMPTCDRVLVYEALSSCLEAAIILNTDTDFRASLKAALDKLPPIKTGKDGAIQEWFEDYEPAHPNHRHSSHLLSLYPFHQISTDKTPELAEAASKSIHRQLNSENWEDVEWSRANMIAFYARLKNAPEAYKNMKGLLREFSRENLFTMSPSGIAGADSDIFEFDANEAGPAALAEMLLQSHEGYIEFLPALPEAWATGSFKGLCARGGAVVDLNWEKGAVTYAGITASTDNTYQVKLPAGLTKILKNGKPVQPEKTDASVISIQLKEGEFLEIK
jgi:alpha-L-fucosidase 2